MRKQTIEFMTIKTPSGVVINRSAIFQPKPNFQGGSIKWYPDKSKQIAK